MTVLDLSFFLEKLLQILSNYKVFMDEHKLDRIW